MSKIILFNQSDNLYAYFKEIFSSDSPAIVITPSPLIADALRKKLADESIFDVITISKFLKGELQELIEEDLSEKFKGKSELILMLSTLWKKLNLGQDFDLFMRCFNLLTDFRSFSLNTDILETVLENYDDTISLGVLRMHQVMTQLDLYDEHRSYFELSSCYREGQIPIENMGKRNIIFYGFDFLSGSQVDLLNSLGIRDEVYIPFFENVFKAKSDFDWISWLKFEDDPIVLDKKSDVKKEASYIEYAKNYLPALILNKDPYGECDILLGTKRASLEQVLEVNVCGSLFKIGANIFDEELAVLIDTLHEEKDLYIDSIDVRLEKALKSQSYRELKTIKVFQETFINWKNLSEANNSLTLFDIKVFKEVLALDLPRVSLINTQRETFKNEIFSLTNIENIKEEKNLIIALASDYGSIKSTVTKYNKDVEKYLASIGPIRRPQFEFEILKEKIQTLASSNIVFLSEFGLIERDYYWKEVLSGFDLKDGVCPDFEQKKHQYLDYPVEKTQLGRYSATMLQTYDDCPRKYFFNYIQKLSPKFDFLLEVDLLTKGQLEHSLIEQYVSTYDLFSKSDYNHLKREIINKNLDEKNINLINMKELEGELDALCRPMIEKLLKIKVMDKTTICFETSLDDKRVRGSIDCIIENDKDIFILDFKRGGGSIPTQKDFLNFEKIQLWFYANYYRTEKCVSLGYVNLSENDKSLLYIGDESEKVLSEILGAKAQVFKDGFEVKLDQYKKHEERLIQKINVDESFLPAPKATKVCSYCHFKTTCSKGVLLEN